MSELILASQSPRRKDILSRMNVGEFSVISSEYEEILDDTQDVRDVAKKLSLGKATWIADHYPDRDAYIIGSDTIVIINGRQLEKPKDINEARDMLISYTKGKSSVVTGVALINRAQGIELVEEDTVDVYFKPDSEEVRAAREQYLASGDWKDKAGGYGIQSGAAVLVDHIEGDYDTIKGLPSRVLSEMLQKVGIDAHPTNDLAPVPQK